MTVAPFLPIFQSEPFPTAYDPVVFPGSNFGDGQHRVLVMEVNSHKELHKTTDFETFTPVNLDWLPAVGNTGADTFQDAVWLPDGTCALYQNDGDAGTTAVWTGTAADIDAGTITRQGQVLAAGGDVGVFYEEATDLIHIYAEDPDNPFGSASATGLTHWTTPADALLTPTQHADAVTTGGSWGTGDPDIIEAFGCYWMFTDYTESHPTYWVALYRSDDLYTWELVDPQFSEEGGMRAGDFDVIDVGTHFVAMCEYTGANAGVGVWHFQKRPFARAQTKAGSSGVRVSAGGRAAVRAGAY